jgi:hypothetical protein
MTQMMADVCTLDEAEHGDAIVALDHYGQGALLPDAASMQGVA